MKGSQNAVRIFGSVTPSFTSERHASLYKMAMNTMISNPPLTTPDSKRNKRGIYGYRRWQCCSCHASTNSSCPQCTFIGPLAITISCASTPRNGILRLDFFYSLPSSRSESCDPVYIITVPEHDGTSQSLHSMDSSQAPGKLEPFFARL